MAAEEIEQTMARTLRNSQVHGISTFPSIDTTTGSAPFSPSTSFSPRSSRGMDEKQGPLSSRISSIVKNFDDDILTPMKQRFLEQHNVYGQFNAKMDENMQKISRSVRDMQAMTLFELAKITSIGRVNKEKSRQDQYRVVAPLGATIARFPWWTISIEALISRASGLLDDILSSQEVFDHFNKKINIKNMKLLSAQIDNVIKDDYTSYDHPAEHNQSVPPSPSKRDLIDNSLMSSLEGSFSPMRNASRSKTITRKKTNKSNSNTRSSSYTTPRDDNVCISALETQEILLFTIVTLLHSLCNDSAKIRELFCFELSDYWISIFNVICKLCPRPDVIVQSYGANQPKVLRSPSKLNRQSSKVTREKSSKDFKLEKKKQRMAKKNKTDDDENSDDQDYGHKFYVSGIPLTSITDFGEPRYGMTVATWQLLVKSRLTIEVLK